MSFVAWTAGSVDFNPLEVVEARSIVDCRFKAFGLRTEMRISDNEREVVVTIFDPTIAAEEVERIGLVMRQPALFEIIDTNGELLEEGAIVETTQGLLGGTPVASAPYETIITWHEIVAAYPTLDQFGTMVVGIDITEEASERLAEHTRTNIGQPMSVVIDKRVVFSGSIVSEISSKAIIPKIPPEEVTEMAMLLNCGPMPVVMEFVGYTEFKR